MASRHHGSGHRDRDPRGGAPRDGAPKRPALNEYWIDGEGIHREVLQGEICRFLGSDATCRPGDYNGRAGYKIKALRPFTPEMLEDLKAASREYRMENRALQDRYREEVSYEDSETRRRNDPSISHGSYSGSSNSGYPPVGSPYAEPSGAYPPMPAGYPAGSNYPSGSGYPSGAGQYPPSAYTVAPTMSGTPSYAGSSDPRYQPHYTYSQPSRGEYAQTDRYYAPGPGYAEPPRSRGEPIPQYAGFARAPTDRGSIDPREYHHDTEMGGTYAAPGGGYPPQRGNAPSPYEGARDPYGSSRPQPDPYSGGSRRR